MDERWTDDDAARVREAARGAVEEFHVAGVAVGVVAGDELAYAEGFGFADIESGRRQAPELRQRIGSITKTMIGLCTMALVDEGRLSLDDRLLDYVPEVAFDGDGGDIRIRHLITHSAGIGEVPTPEDLKDGGTASLWSSEPDNDVIALFPRGIVLDVPPARSGRTPTTGSRCSARRSPASSRPLSPRLSVAVSSRRSAWRTPTCSTGRIRT